ncbi:hypothetical protein CUR85_18215 [Sulfitobacter faviae]|nr:hypothetical protein [Sulfitobacter sp.]MDH4541786.1 hypothetical protein [Sulfitobacter faviae]OZB18563.1 MAG: hypothetical protein B7X53_02740 [Hyphomonas sp. 34-62-18]TKA84617.1 hypothetical protein FCK22_14675 [Sulfitobacter sp. 15WGC]HCR95308.1 hypothetical protein [Oceanicaulis sp.]
MKKKASIGLPATNADFVALFSQRDGFTNDIVSVCKVDQPGDAAIEVLRISISGQGWKRAKR